MDSLFEYSLGEADRHPGCFQHTSREELLTGSSLIAALMRLRITVGGTDRSSFRWAEKVSLSLRTRLRVTTRASRERRRLANLTKQKQGHNRKRCIILNVILDESMPQTLSPSLYFVHHSTFDFHAITSGCRRKRIRYLWVSRMPTPRGVKSNNIVADDHWKYWLCWYIYTFVGTRSLCKHQENDK